MTNKLIKSVRLLYLLQFFIFTRNPHYCRLEKMIKLKQNLGTRQFAREIVDKILGEKEKILDFSQVSVVSRSFSNELVNLEKKHKISIKKINMSKNVEYMFSIADKVLDSDILARTKYKVVSVEKYAHLI